MAEGWRGDGHLGPPPKPQLPRWRATSPASPMASRARPGADPRAQLPGASRRPTRRSRRPSSGSPKRDFQNMKRWDARRAPTSLPAVYLRGRVGGRADADAMVRGCRVDSSRCRCESRTSARRPLSWPDARCQSPGPPQPRPRLPGARTGPPVTPTRNPTASPPRRPRPLGILALAMSAVRAFGAGAVRVQVRHLRAVSGRQGARRASRRR